MARELLSIFATVAILFGASLAQADGGLCSELFSGWDMAQREWLQKDKVAKPIPATEAQQKFLVELKNRLGEQGFSTQMKSDKRTLLVVDKKDSGFRREFDLSQILNNHAQSIAELTRINNLLLTRELVKQTKNLTNTNITPSGIELLMPLRKFKEKTDDNLHEDLISQLKILAKRTETQAGIDAALITAEMLLRRGFTVEILPSGRGTFIVKINEHKDGDNQAFMKVIRAVEKTTGGIFALDPTFFAGARDGGGVSDPLHFDYSLNTEWLWDKPEKFEKPSDTLLHEIFHISNMHAWLARPGDEFLQSFNGFMWAKGQEQLGQFGYSTYLSLDEILAAYEDSLQAETLSSRIFYRDRTLDLIRAARERIPALKEQVKQGHFEAAPTSNGRYLQIEVAVQSGYSKPLAFKPEINKSSHHKSPGRIASYETQVDTSSSESGLAFLFPDLSLSQPLEVLIARYVNRLDMLEGRLRELEARAVNEPPK